MIPRFAYGSTEDGEPLAFVLHLHEPFALLWYTCTDDKDRFNVWCPDRGSPVKEMLGFANMEDLKYPTVSFTGERLPELLYVENSTERFTGVLDLSRGKLYVPGPDIELVMAEGFQAPAVDPNAGKADYHSIQRWYHHFIRRFRGDLELLEKLPRCLEHELGPLIDLLDENGLPPRA